MSGGITFLFECREDNIPLPLDFLFCLKNAITFQKEFNGVYNSIRYVQEVENVYEGDDNPDKTVPVGSVEFVDDYFRINFGIVLKPRNVPECLFRYSKRRITNINLKGNYKFDDVFVKSNEKIKYEGNGIKNGEERLFGSYQVSEIVDDIESEWRGFVFNGTLVDIRRYAGEFDMFPDIKLVKEMVSNYNNCSPAYTIDVGISKTRGTMLIEIHDFFSCGLYGFEQYNIPPFMFTQTFFYLKNNASKK